MPHSLLFGGVQYLASLGESHSPRSRGDAPVERNGLDLSMIDRMCNDDPIEHRNQMVSLLVMGWYSVVGTVFGVFLVCDCVQDRVAHQGHCTESKPMWRSQILHEISERDVWIG